MVLSGYCIGRDQICRLALWGLIVALTELGGSRKFKIQTTSSTYGVATEPCTRMRAIYTASLAVKSQALGYIASQDCEGIYRHTNSKASLRKQLVECLLFYWIDLMHTREDSERFDMLM